MSLHPQVLQSSIDLTPFLTCLLLGLPTYSGSRNLSGPINALPSPEKVPQFYQHVRRRSLRVLVHSRALLSMIARRSRIPTHRH